MADGFDDFLAASGPRVQLKSHINMRDLVGGKHTIFEVDQDAAAYDDNDDYFSDDDDDDDSTTRPGNSKKFYENDNYQAQPINKNVIRLDEPILKPFGIIEEEMESIHPSGKVKKLIMKEGHKVIESDAKVFVHYAAFAEGDSDHFDSTLKRKRPQGFFLGENCGLPGFLIAIRSMRMEEISKFIVYPELAYGPVGCPPRIPENSKILYVIQMVQYIPKEKLNDVFFMSADDRTQLPFSDILTAANECKRKGNGEYKSGAFTSALKEYSRGIILLEDYSTTTEDDNRKREDLLGVMYVNKAQSLIRLERAPQACVACKLALKTGNNEIRPKALIRFAEAKLMLESLEDAEKFCKESMKIFSKQGEVPAKCYEIEKKIKVSKAKQKEVEKLLASKMLGLQPSDPSSSKLQSESQET